MAVLFSTWSFLLLLTGFDKQPITFLNSKAWYCCSVLPATSSILALSIPQCAISYECGIESPHTWSYFALYKSKPGNMTIELFTLTKSIISAIPEQRLSDCQQRNEHGHVRQKNSLFGREDKLLIHSKMQGLVQGHRICCSSCSLKIIILIYNGLYWQEGNIEKLLQLQAPAFSKTMSQLMMSLLFFKTTIFLSSSSFSVCNK